MSFLKKIRCEWEKSTEMKGDWRREVTRWDVAFIAIIILTILILGFVLTYLGILEP